MPFGKKANDREGTGVFTLQGAVVFCGRCGRGVRLATSDLTGGPFRCRKCTRIFCGRCFSEMSGTCLDDTGSAQLDAQDFLRECGLMDAVFADIEPNVLVEVGGSVAHVDGKARKVSAGTAWKFEEHELVISQGDQVRARVDVTTVTKIYTAEEKGALVSGIHEWNRKYRVKVLPQEGGKGRGHKG